MNDNVFGVTPVADADQGETPSPAPVTEPQTETPVAADPEPAPEPAPVEPAQDDDDEKELLSENPAEGFRIGSKTYKDVGSADRAFRQYVGRAQAESRRRREAEEERDRTVALLETLRAERAAAPQPQVQGETGTPAEPAPAPKPKRLTDLVSDDEFDALVAEHGPAKAFRRLAELTEERLTEALEESNRDIRPFVREREVATKTAQTFDGCAAMKGADGQPLFPEIADATTPEAQAVFGIWQRNFQNPQLAPLAFTPEGVRFAVLEHRSANGQPASSRPRTAASAAVAARRTADKGLQSMGTGSASATRHGSPGPVSNDEERVQAAVRAGRHEIFGVTVRAA